MLAASAALPPDVEQLVQEDKYSEALARVEVLLQQKPDDQELLSARKDLLALVPGSAPAPVPAPPPVPKPQPETLSRIDAKELEMIMADLNKTAGDARQPHLKELAAKTGILIRTVTESPNLWAMRALAVVELNQAEAAKEAGANLLRLGADRSDNDQMLSLLVMLKRKGWLKTPAGLEEERRLAAEKEAADKRIAEKRCQAFYSIGGYNVLIYNASDGSLHLRHWRAQMAAEACSYSCLAVPSSSHLYKPSALPTAGTPALFSDLNQLNRRRTSPGALSETTSGIRKRGINVNRGFPGVASHPLWQSGSPSSHR
ncbi:MAG: hypothetical protein J0L73_10085 [Verrucomicrobia bacterium]|nr:hypothetical protein [Verrucomicrobiota bacterium]